MTVTQAFLPALRSGRGRIVNISSTSGLIGMPGTGAYCASKFALEAVTECLRQELQPWGIRVSAVEPGVVNTPIWEKSLAEGEALLSRMPPEAGEMYGPLLDALRRMARRSEGSEPTAVAEAVRRALQDKIPRTRYLVGTDARAVRLLSRLPDRLRDVLLAADRSS